MLPEQGQSMTRATNEQAGEVHRSPAGDATSPPRPLVAPAVGVLEPPPPPPRRPPRPPLPTAPTRISGTGGFERNWRSRAEGAIARP